MKEQLTQYVNLLFAGTQGCEDIRQEILQNTLDRYDDLIAEGKSPDAAYRLAIMGIGDIGEILGAGSARQAPPPPVPPTAPRAAKEPRDPVWKKVLRVIAVFLYIICPIPLFVMGGMINWEAMGLGGFLDWDIIGLCGTLCIAAVATVFMMLGAKREPPKPVAGNYAEPESPKAQLHKSIDSLVWALGLAVYFILSFATGAWYVTWVLFPIIGAVKGLIHAIIDFKEAA